MAALLATGPAAAWNPRWTEPVAPFRVIDNVYYVGSAGVSAWIIRTSRGLILLDAGMPEYAPQVEANIRTLGFRLSDVKVMLNSHAHFDHSGGLAKIKADTGARLIASRGDRFALEHGVYPGSESDHNFDAPPVKVDQVFAANGEVRLGEVRMQVVPTPGHSAGCTSYLLSVRDHGQPHTAFFFCSATVAANRLVPDPQYPGIVDDYRQTFARLKTIQADVFLAPHDNFFDLDSKRAKLRKGRPNPFIVPGELKAVTESMEADFIETLAEQTAKAAAK
jgi:metallo-beta-lactamase class B